MLPCVAAVVGALEVDDEPLGCWTYTATGLGMLVRADLDVIAVPPVRAVDGQRGRRADRRGAADLAADGRPAVGRPGGRRGLAGVGVRDRVVRRRGAPQWRLTAVPAAASSRRWTISCRSSERGERLYQIVNLAERVDLVRSVVRHGLQRGRCSGDVAACPEIIQRGEQGVAAAT